MLGSQLSHPLCLKIKVWHFVSFTWSQPRAAILVVPGTFSQSTHAFLPNFLPHWLWRRLKFLNSRERKHHTAVEGEAERAAYWD